MITKWFFNSLTDEEKGLILMIAEEAFQPLGYDPIYYAVKKDFIMFKLEQYKQLIIPENIAILEELQKKVATEI